MKIRKILLISMIFSLIILCCGLGRREGMEKKSQIEETFNSAEDEEWNLVLVNKWNRIPENWKPELIKTEGGEYVDKRIYEPLMKMLTDAKTANFDQMPQITSGYRTEKKQKKIYEEKIREYRMEGFSETDAVSYAEKWVAIPGTSEHQLGVAVDINGASYDVYLWLQENSHKYGFIFRYPGSKTDITGVSEEVWHYRYVGTEAAVEMYEQDLCLEEYLEQRKRH